LNKQIKSAIDGLQQSAGATSDKSITALSPDSFRELLESALTKVKNNPDTAAEDLIWIDDVQKALERKTPADLARIDTLKAELATLSTPDPKSNPASTSQATASVPNKSTNSSAKPSPPPTLSLPELILVEETQEKTKKQDSKLMPSEEQKQTRDTNPGTTPTKPSAAKKVLINTVKGTGVVVAGLTVVEGGIQLYDYLTKKKEK